MTPESRSNALDRRRFLIGGSILLVASILSAQAEHAGVVRVETGKKPAFLPAPDSKDPAAHSTAEQLFWGEQMMEHALFLTMFMPGDDLATQRTEAARFQKVFEQRLAGVTATPLDAAGYVAANGAMQKDAEEFYEAHKQMPLDERKLEKAIEAIVDFKAVAEKGIDAGTIKSIIHPVLANHVRREAIKAADEFRRSA